MPSSPFPFPKERLLCHLASRAGAYGIASWATPRRGGTPVYVSTRMPDTRQITLLSLAIGLLALRRLHEHRSSKCPPSRSRQSSAGPMITGNRRASRPCGKAHLRVRWRRPTRPESRADQKDRSRRRWPEPGRATAVRRRQILQVMRRKLSPFLDQNQTSPRGRSNSEGHAGLEKIAGA